MTHLFAPQTITRDPAREIIVVGFAGGGGSCEGIKMALGRSPEEALNHDPEAVAMHAANHPETRHWCQNIWQADPAEVAAGRPIGLAWFSPDCKHFSKAKGGKPRARNIRDLAWVVVAYAKLPRHIRPRVLMVENVEEFQTWGPLLEDNTPCQDGKGATFKKWVGELKRLGYRVEWRVERACDFGAPTIRKRLYVVARCDGQPIVWPDPTHGPGRALPYRTAADIINWSLPCPSIFTRAKELAEATMRRIATGTMRYVVNAAEPFIVSVAHGYSGGRREYPITDPLGTVTSGGIAHGLVVPVLSGCGGRAAQSPPRPADRPMGTITSKADQILIAPHLTKYHGNSSGSAGDAPFPTITANSFHKRPGGNPPIALVAAHLTRFHTKSVGSDAAAPVPTIETVDKVGLVSAFLAKHYGGVVGHGVEQAIGTVTTVDHHSLVAAHLTQFRPNSKGHSCDEPLRTIIAGQSETHQSTGIQFGVVAAHLTHFYGSGSGQGDPRAPIKTVTATGQHAGLVAAFLTKYYGQGGQDQDCRQPLHTIPTVDRFGLVTVMVAGEPYVLSDIGMRMLTPRELFRAQGFPESYVIDIEVNGKRLSKAAQVRMCGNSVCPPVAAALVAANVPEMALVAEAAE